MSSATPALQRISKCPQVLPSLSRLLRVRRNTIVSSFLSSRHPSLSDKGHDRSRLPCSRHFLDMRYLPTVKELALALPTGIMISFVCLISVRTLPCSHQYLLRLLNKRYDQIVSCPYLFRQVDSLSVSLFPILTSFPYFSIVFLLDVRLSSAYFSVYEKTFLHVCWKSYEC